MSLNNFINDTVTIQYITTDEIYNSILYIQELSAALLLCVAFVYMFKFHRKIDFLQYVALAIFIGVESFSRKKIVKAGFLTLHIAKLMVGFQTYLVDLARKGRVPIESKLREHEPKFLSAKSVAMFSTNSEFIDRLFFWRQDRYFIVVSIYLSVFVLCPSYARSLIDLFMVTITLYGLHKKAPPNANEKKETDWKKDVFLFISETIGFVVTYLTYPEFLCYFDIFLIGIFAFVFSSIITLSFLLIRRFTREPLTHSI